MLTATIQSLITQVIKVKLSHPKGLEVSHAHTVAHITQDANGIFWLEMRCRHHDCKGLVRKRVPGWLVEEWAGEEN